MIRIGISSTESEREHFMENMNNAANVSRTAAIAQIMAQHRQTVQKYGEYYGQQLYTITAANPDPKWKEDMQSGKNTLRFEIKAYIIKAIDIRSLDLLERDLDGFPKIIINKEDNDPSLVFQLAEPDFSKATRENVLECIDRLSKPNSKPMFFSAEDLPLLTKLIAISNQSSLAAYEDFSRKFMQLSETVRGYMDANDRLQTEYLRQCGVNNNDTELRVNVTVTEQQ